jgi:hypothetical protein
LNKISEHNQSQSAALSRLVARVGAWSLATFITALSLVPLIFRPESGTPHNFKHFAVGHFRGRRRGRANRSRPPTRVSDFTVDALAIVDPNTTRAFAEAWRPAISSGRSEQKLT